MSDNNKSPTTANGGAPAQSSGKGKPTSTTQPPSKKGEAGK